MAKYSILIQIAEKTIRFESELEIDIRVLQGFFKYHLIESEQDTDITVVLKRQASFRMPTDAQMLWQSKCHGILEPDGRMGRRRIRTSSKYDTFGVASCYVSAERGEYYYGLMRDNTWICCNPSEKKIDYVLHQPLEKHGLKREEMANPIGALPLLIHVIGTFHGRFLLHGAAVTVDGKASLFLGNSGSGKSTLCTDLAKQKALFMGDDLVLIYKKDGVPMIGSLLFPAKLHISSTKEKDNIDVPEEMHTDYCLSAPLRAAYLVQQSGLPISTVSPGSPSALMQNLLNESNGMKMQIDQKQWLDTMYSISESVPFFFFNFGDRSTLSISILND